MTKLPNKEDRRSDAWQRFERAVDAAAKSGPKHRKTKKAKESRNASSSKKP